MLTDDLNIRDGLGVSGFVVITDLKTGKIIVKKHNMITTWGKKIIYYNFITNIFKDEQLQSESYKATKYYTEMEELRKYKLCKIKLGKSESETQYTMTDLKESVGNSVKVLTANMITIPDYNEALAPHIKFTCEFSNTGRKDSNADEVSELGLFLSKDDTVQESISDGDKLFSRITFDPIPYLEDTSFKLEYYIYF